MAMDTIHSNGSLKTVIGDNINLLLSEIRNRSDPKKAKKRRQEIIFINQ